MNKQELFKQADYTFQRGNRELAKKYLTDFLAQYPNEESAWMLMARIEVEPPRKCECYQHALKINPKNIEAHIWLERTIPAKTRPRRKTVNQFEVSRPSRKLLSWVSLFIALAVLFGTTSYFVARRNPASAVARFFAIATPTMYETIPITGDIARQTRAQMSAKYPQYAPLLDALIGFAMNSTKDGLEGAPERPGAQIAPSDITGREAKTALEKALPQPGSLSSATLTEIQLTSWLAMEMKNNPDLPLSDVQVYLRNRKIQIWGMVTGSVDSTAALIVGNLEIDSNKNPKIKIESVQIGTQAIPGPLVAQMEAWLNQMLAEEISKQAPGLEIMNINISNGLVTVSGMR